MVADVLDRFQIVGKKDLYPESALGRPATAGRRRARRDRQSAGRPRRRADRQSALGARQGNHGAVPLAERRRRHDHSGDALGSERLVRHRESSTCATAGSSATERPLRLGHRATGPRLASHAAGRNACVLAMDYRAFHVAGGCGCAGGARFDPVLLLAVGHRRGGHPARRPPRHARLDRPRAGDRRIDRGRRDHVLDGKKAR